MSKPNCYNCIFRGSIMGSTHSSCSYGDNELNLFTIVSSKNYNNAQTLDIKATQHGINSGWFNWPVDFDPVWLVNCNGFTEK